MSNPLNGVRPGFVKTVSALTSIATVLTLSGAAYLAPLAASAAVPSDYGLREGNMISAAGSNDPDVYIVNDWGYKRLFLNPVIFNMYGQLTGGWALVKNVSAAVRDAFPSSGLFRDCQVGSSNNNGNVYAVEVTGEDTGVLHHVVMTGDQAVAQDSNFFKKVFCINDNELNWYAKSSDYTSLSQVPVYSRVPGSTPTPTPIVGTGPVSASLSPDNPAAGTVIAGQGVADLAHFRLTNPAGTAVAVNSIKFQRLGISGDSTFTNVYVFSMNPNARLTDAVSPATGVISFNGGTSTPTIVTIPAGSYIDISVKSDIYGTSTAGQTVGVALTAVNGIAVSGLNGNLFQIASAPSDLATAVFAATASILPSTGTTDPLKDTIVWQNQLTVSNKNVILKSFALRQINSINSADVSNFRLIIDGVQVAQVQNLDSNGYVTFNPASPYTIVTGSRTLKVLADITGGTGRKLTMSLRSSADLQITDSNYGAGITATITSSGSFPASAGDLTVNSGSVVVQKDVTAPSGNIVQGSSDAVLGRWTFTAYGEPTKVSTLVAGLRLSGSSVSAFVLNTSALRNGRIMAYPVGNPGAATQYGSTATLLYSNTASRSYTPNLVINPGSPMTVELRADIYDSGDASDYTTSNTTIVGTLYTGSSNGQGMVSLATSNVPSAISAGNTLTVKTGAVTISKTASFPDQSIAVPQPNVKLADLTVSNTSTEAINVNTLTLIVTAGAASTLGDLSNVYLKWNGISTSVKSTIGTATGASSAQTFSVAQVLPVNGSVHIEVFADIGTRTAAATATYQSSVAVSGTTAQSSITVNTIANGTSSTGAAVVFAGQTMTVSSAGFTTAVAASNPVAQLVAGNVTTDVARFSFTGTVGNQFISEIQLKTLASSSAGITSVILKNYATGAVIGTLPLSRTGGSSGSDTVTFGGLTGLTVPANDPTGLVLTAAVTTSTVGVNAATSSLNVGLTMDYVKYIDPTGVLQTSNTDRVGSNAYLHASYPAVTAVALPSTLLSTGLQTISKFTVAAVGSSNATIGIGRFYWTINKTSTPAVASTGWALYEDGVDISTQGKWASASVGAGQTAGKISWTASSAAPFSGAVERTVSTTGHTYELRANVTATGTAGDSIQAVLTAATSASSPTASYIKVIGGATLATGLSGSAIIWSDRSSLSHSALTADWMNDYLVKTLPISQGLSR